MGFGGGGGGVLTNHTHDPLIPLDGGALATNATSFGLANQSLLVSDGVNIQELSVGAAAQVLGVSGGAPAWITNTSNPLIKVTKTFADIAAGQIPIYTLAQDSALVNLWTDITTVFDGATTTTEIGDSADPNGFSEAANWQTLGLTNATRGAYVTEFKTMRSTSGNTAIVAGGGSTLTEAGDAANNNATQGEANYKQITGLTSGDAITALTWDFYNNGAMNMKFALFDDNANTPDNMLGNEVEIAVPAITNTYTTYTVPTSGSPTVPVSGIVWVAFQSSSTPTSIRSTANPPSSYANSIYDSLQVYAAGFTDPSTATLGGGNNYRAGVNTPAALTATQGEADIYLQVVD